MQRLYEVYLDQEAQVVARYTAAGLGGKNRDFLTGLYALNLANAPKSASGIETTKGTPERLGSLAGVLGDPLCCVSCRLKTQVTDRTIIYHLTTRYRVAKSTEGRFCFIFPISACVGAVASFSVRINSKVLMWELIQAVVPASGGPPTFLPMGSNVPASQMSDKQRRSEETVVYAFSPTASDSLGKLSDVGDEILLQVQWSTKEIRRGTAPPSLLVTYSFACAPRLPEELLCHTAFQKSVQMVCSVSPRGATQALDWKGTGGRCTVRLVPGGAVPALCREDELVVFTFFFENPLDIEHRYITFAVISVIFVVALTVWFLLTKDLEF
ncbi:hypothetical protein ERJ75_000705800 [Trypanosoma vivax]|uniref:Uncharacterized protein n=1 Tax=Trypanosoma vivax (strain Y486) TaxID=1055687 RepID=G0TU26_TRYVY|nr:hypothetical protein TRVL_00170 [Trypanosoma vivax]KAH8613597.1 hypothetical protein ERJ75_000705800 [Trypanosoma vivax]CCC47460.1 conserved hypothetical protein [Trypanosoma vivax Y486]